MDARVRLVDILLHMFIDWSIVISIESFGYWFHVIIAYIVLVIICGFLSMS